MTDAQREILNKLVDPALPVAAWLKERTTFPPSEDWPDAGKRSLKDVGVVEQIEARLKLDDPFEPLAERWRERIKNPLEIQRALGRAKWRSKRMDSDGNPLDRNAVFGVLKSSNFIASEIDERDGKTVIPLTRKRMYEKALPMLEAVVNSRGLLAEKMPSVAWERLVEDMQGSNMGDWSLKEPSSSEFLRQFVKDCLEIAMSLRSAKLAAVMPDSVGEHRRPGNSFTISKVDTARNAFEKKLGISKP